MGVHDFNEEGHARMVDVNWIVKDQRCPCRRSVLMRPDIAGVAHGRRARRETCSLWRRLRASWPPLLLLAGAHAIPWSYGRRRLSFSTRRTASRQQTSPSVVRMRWRRSRRSADPTIHE